MFIRDAGDEVLHAKAEGVFVAAPIVTESDVRRRSDAARALARAERRESSP